MYEPIYIIDYSSRDIRVKKTKLAYSMTPSLQLHLVQDI